MHKVNKDMAVEWRFYRIHGGLCKERLINLIVSEPAIQHESLMSKELPQETATTHKNRRMNSYSGPYCKV